MSRYDPQRRRRQLTTRANAATVDALLDGDDGRFEPRAAQTEPSAAPPTTPRPRGTNQPEPVGPDRPSARAGCLGALFTLGRR